MRVVTQPFFQCIAPSPPHPKQVEVLARVFSGLPTDALQAVELVCRLWRSIGRSGCLSCS